MAAELTIFEAKLSADRKYAGTFRPLGASEPSWKNMNALSTVYAAWPKIESEDEAPEMIDMYDNPQLKGSPVGSIAFSRLKEDIWPLGM